MTTQKKGAAEDSQTPNRTETTEQHNALAMRPAQSLALQAMDPGELIQQIKLIQQVMKEVMIKDEHYGVIPGTQKPSLLKPGAEKLGFLFRLAPEFVIRRSDLEHGHREYEITCTLKQIHTGLSFGMGVGLCTTMESRYRYRTEEVSDPQGNPRLVPKTYWDARNPAILGGTQFRPKKQDGRWIIVHRVENPDIADTYNSALKIAKKRAHVDAILTATAASDVFAQDLEDLSEPPDDGAAKTDAGKAKAERKPLPKRGQGKEPPKPKSRAKGEQADAKELVSIIGIVENARTNDYAGKTYYFIDINGREIMTGDPTLGEDLMSATGAEISVTCVPRPEKGPNKYRALEFGYTGSEAGKEGDNEP